MPARDQQRAAAGIGVLQHPRGRAKPPSGGDHLMLQVGKQFAAPPSDPTLGAQRDATGQIG